MLDDFSMMAIFDFMDFEQLFLTADCGVRFRWIIHQHYAIPKYKIDQKTIYIGDFDATKETIEFRTDSIHLHDYATALRFMRIFGSAISNLSIDDNLEENQYNLIGEYLNEYVVESLNVLKLTIQNAEMIWKWRKSFKQLTALDLTVRPMKNGKICHLNSFFPKLRELRMKWLTKTDPKCLHQNFRYLKELHYGDDSGTDTSIRQFIGANGQLDSLRLENRCDPMFLQFLNRHIPKLQALTIFHVNNDFFMKNAYETVHFVHLKELSIELITGGAKIIQNFPFLFDRLEELELVEQNTSYEWVKFIGQQKSLRKLHIANDGWTSNEWKSIGVKLINLSELSVMYRFQSSNGLFHLIENSESLQKISFQIRFVQQQLRVKVLMPDKWKIISEDEPYPYDLTFRRSD